MAKRVANKCCCVGRGEPTASVEMALAGILENPESGALIGQGIRRRLARVFPYALLYSIDVDTILVVAVMHCHQRPGYWQTRLDS